MRWAGGVGVGVGGGGGVGLGIQTKNPANGRASYLIVPGELVRAPLP
jgi:hypothetical protein